MEEVITVTTAMSSPYHRNTSFVKTFIHRSEKQNEPPLSWTENVIEDVSGTDPDECSRGRFLV